ncbi:hypothetical protein B0H11DRAFT_2262218 [Mycena galericulata]|nr:hypothetical protein B0H11DRAFT_2262218 [Mycena galericulata]
MAPTMSRSSRHGIDTDTGVDGEDPHQLTGDRGILISDDGRRRLESLHNVAHKKRRIKLVPDLLNDSLAKWIPVDDEGYTHRPEADDISDLPQDPGTSLKRKSYSSSDDPMSEFPEVRQLFSDEILRRSGLGNGTLKQACGLCDKPVGNSSDTHTACYRSTPLHFIEEWTGRYWKATTLRVLGLVYQLGHGGLKCRFPDSTVRTLVVIDTSGIHRIRYRFCGCSVSDNANNLSQLLRNAWYPATKTDPDTCATFDVLELFRLLNVGGSVNAHDFISALERKTEPLEASGMRRDRYKAFMRMSRQYAFLQRTRRAGRGHDPAGLVATKAGECMVICWACPYDGRNIPKNWRDVDPKFSYLFKLIVAIDANFKLKNRIRTNEHSDPSLGPGWGAFVEPQEYRKHLRKYVAEKDISTCIAFAALMQKETRNTAGLRVSGVGGCVCARHECMRPNGLGDLQKGERYANMDFITMSALKGFDLDELVISYDIACQWEKNLPARMAKLPPDLQIDLDSIRLQCGLPVWHASAHEKSCSNKNSLSFLEGLGRSDGEGVERLWAFLNSISYHTKDMNIGNRADAVEDKLDSHNYTKNLGCVDILRRRLVVAIAERAKQVAAFKEINKTISPEVRADWQACVDAFSKDKSSPNPYVLNAKDGPTEADIRLELRKKEVEDAETGIVPLHGTSATAFLAAGLQLEHAQRRIRAEISGTTMTADRESKINEHRVSFMSKLRRFRDLQRVYTPGAIRALLAEEAARDHDAAPPKAESVRLYLPSELSEAERLHGCQRGIVDMETRLREAQCSDALVDIRAQLHAKSHLISFKNENITGQIQSTRSQSLITQVGARVVANQHKYTQARRALVQLKGEGHAPHFKKLRASDLTLPGEQKEDDSAAREKLARIGSGKQGRAARNGASTNRVLSWIWTARGPIDMEEQELHESLRVEWSRAKARRSRWVEEVELLREEMRRVLRYLEWQAAFWEDRIRITEARDDVAVPMRQGMAAYAAKQADTWRELAGFYKGQLNMSVGATVDSVLAGLQDDDLTEFFAEAVPQSVSQPAA